MALGGEWVGGRGPAGPGVPVGRDWPTADLDY